MKRASWVTICRVPVILKTNSVCLCMNEGMLKWSWFEVLAEFSEMREIDVKLLNTSRSTLNCLTINAGHAMGWPKKSSQG